MVARIPAKNDLPKRKSDAEPEQKQPSARLPKPDPSPKAVKRLPRKREGSLKRKMSEYQKKADAENALIDATMVDVTWGLWLLTKISKRDWKQIVFAASVLTAVLLGIAGFVALALWLNA